MERKTFLGMEFLRVRWPPAHNPQTFINQTYLLHSIQLLASSAAIEGRRRKKNQTKRRKKTKEPINSTLLFDGAKQSRQKKNELLDFPRSGAAWCSACWFLSPPPQLNFIPFQFSCCRRNQRRYLSSSSASFIQPITSLFVCFFGRSHWPLCRPITHPQSKRGSDWFHDSAAFSSNKKINLFNLRCR